MNILFLTQSSTLAVFYEMSEYLRHRGILERAGFYLSDRAYFERFSHAGALESGPDLLLKDWEIIRDSATGIANQQNIEAYRQSLGIDTFWGALVSDRRVYGGPVTTLKQDYRQKYSHERLMAILELALERMEALFSRLNPDAVVSFQANTLGEYLAYFFARRWNIVFLNLRPTRIRNFMYAGESIFEPSDYLTQSYRALMTERDDSISESAQLFLKQIRLTDARYEGVVTASAKPPKTGGTGEPLSLRKIARHLRNFQRDVVLLTGSSRSEHRPTTLESVWFGKIHRPARTKYVDLMLQSRYVRESDLLRLDYAFFPLHTEPEVTLRVYSYPYLNQIEVVRLFSQSLPVHMKLLVKEHPGSVGKRPLSYYRKLLQIPNVLLVHPAIGSRPVLQRSRLATIIAGSVGLEALILRKPVIALGNTPFQILPDTMIRHVTNPFMLAHEIRDLLANHRHDENALISYLAAVIKNSVPVDWYSVLLGRRDAYRLAQTQRNNSKEQERAQQLATLAEYLLKRTDEFSVVSSRAQEMHFPLR